MDGNKKKWFTGLLSKFSKKKKNMKLSRIPEELQIQIVQKMDHLSFIRFEQSSRRAKMLAEAVNSRIYVDVSNRSLYAVELGKDPTGGVRNPFLATPLLKMEDGKITHQSFDETRFSFVAKEIIIREVLTQEFCEELIAFFKKISPRSKKISLHGACSFEATGCSLESFNEFLTTIGGLDTVWCPNISKEYFATDSMKKINKIFATTTALNDEAILALKAEVIQLKTGQKLTSFGINRLLNQCLSGNRNLKYVMIDVDEEPEVEEVFHGIEHECLLESRALKEFEIGEGDKKLHISVRPSNIEINLISCRKW